MTTARLELFFQPPDTGVQVGKTAYLTSASNTTRCCLAESRTITLNNTLVVASTQQDSYFYAEIPVNTSNLVQANFNQSGDQTSIGNVVGVIELGGNRLFIPSKGCGWYDGTDLQIRVFGKLIYYKP